VAWRLSPELGAFVGHLFPAWLGFKGGKGVATYIGVLLGIAWPVALAFCAIWLAVAALTRYSSLAALIASALTPWRCGASAWGPRRHFSRRSRSSPGSCTAATSARLIQGTEGKIGKAG